MHFKTEFIRMHEQKPIYSVSFCDDSYKFATGGADFAVRIWAVVKTRGSTELQPSIDYLSSLLKHTNIVSAVKFSNSGLLASGGDDMLIHVWQFSQEIIPLSDGTREEWTNLYSLNCASQISDIAWSSDSGMILGACMDHSVVGFRSSDKSCIFRLSDHSHFVQGIAIDPKSLLIASQSADRTLKIYSTTNTKKSTDKAISPQIQTTTSTLRNSKSKIYFDETLPSFFRRLKFSSDGNFLFVPAGIVPNLNATGGVVNNAVIDVDVKKEEKVKNCLYIYKRGEYSNPISFIREKSAVVGVAVNPVNFELLPTKQETPQTLHKKFSLDYRQIFAVATINSVTLYDTQHTFPICRFVDFHYANITDMSWSSDGRVLVFSSQDGYVSFCVFGKEELGKVILKDGEGTIREGWDEMQLTEVDRREVYGGKKRKEEVEEKKAVVEVIDVDAETASVKNQQVETIIVVDGDTNVKKRRIQPVWLNKK